MLSAFGEPPDSGNSAPLGALHSASISGSQERRLALLDERADALHEVPRARETVILDVTSDDVAHSWWIPKLGGKMDAVPGYVNHTWFRIPPSAIPAGKKSVIYTGQCAELCGRNHANMLARVIGMRMDDYKAWYQRKVQQVQQARRLAAAQQKALLQQQKLGQGQQ